MGFAKPFLILLILVLGRSALADDKVAAKKHYELGKRHFNVNEFAEAIEEFKTAYKLYPEANDLYNIAQAYRLLGDCVNAATFYGNYQRDEKNKKLRDSVDKVKAEMEACASAPKPTDPAVTETKPDPGPAVPPPQTYRPSPNGGPPSGENAMRAPPGPEDPNKARRYAGVTLMTVGGLFLFGTIYWAVEADSRGKKVDECNLDELCSDIELADFEHDHEAAKRALGGSFGGAIVFGGVGYILYRISKKPDHARVTLMPTRHGAAIGWAF